jgi:hypothetical protein
VGRFPWRKLGPLPKSGPTPMSARLRPRSNRVAWPAAHATVGFEVGQYKTGQNGGVVRVNPNRIPHSSTVAPRLWSAWPCLWWWLVIAESSPTPLASPLGDLLWRQTLSTHPTSSTSLPLFLGRSPTRPGRRVPRPRCSTFAGWGDCNTLCYGSPNQLVITFIRCLIMHQVPRWIKF